MAPLLPTGVAFGGGGFNSGGFANSIIGQPWATANIVLGSGTTTWFSYPSWVTMEFGTQLFIRDGHTPVRRVDGSLAPIAEVGEEDKSINFYRPADIYTIMFFDDVPIRQFLQTESDSQTDYDVIQSSMWETLKESLWYA